MNEVKIVDYLNGECPYIGCKYNDMYGICICGENDFLLDMMEDISFHIEGNVIDKNATFGCFMKDVPEGICETCGSELEKILSSKGEYMGKPIKMYDYMCPYCD